MVMKTERERQVEEQTDRNRHGRQTNRQRQKDRQLTDKALNETQTNQTFNISVLPNNYTNARVMIEYIFV